MIYFCACWDSSENLQNKNLEELLFEVGNVSIFEFFTNIIRSLNLIYELKSCFEVIGRVVFLKFYLPQFFFLNNL